MSLRALITFPLCVLVSLLTFGPEPYGLKIYPGMRTPEALLRGSLPPFNTVAEARARTCALAAAAIPSSLPFSLYPDDLVGIVAYKDAWKTVCRSGKKIDMADLYQLARQLEEMLHTIVFSDDLPARASAASAAARSDLIYQRLDALDRFVPAFYGHAEGDEFYGFNRSMFYIFALQGSADDQTFFGLHFKYRRQPLYPWQLSGRCTRFGDFDWIEAAKDFRAAQTALASAVYRQTVAEWEKALLFEFDASRSLLCSCSSYSEDVKQDAASLAAFYGGQKGGGEIAEALRLFAKGLDAKERRVRNFSEEGCAYR